MTEPRAIDPYDSVADTRRRLLSAAVEVLQDGGYGAASVAAISTRAGLAAGTLYRHFPSKADLFVEVFRTVADQELAAIQSAVDIAATAGERIDAVVATFAARALARPRLAWALVYEPLDPAVDAQRVAYRRECSRRLAMLVREHVEAGELPSQDPDTTAAALIGAIAEALVGPLAPAAGGGVADHDAVIASLTAFCRRAVGVDAAGVASAPGPTA